MTPFGKPACIYNYSLMIVLVTGRQAQGKNDGFRMTNLE
jgi:hypothetical protein